MISPRLTSMVVTDVVDLEAGPPPIYLEAGPPPISPRNLAKAFEPEDVSKLEMDSFPGRFDHGRTLHSMSDTPVLEPQSRAPHPMKLISPEDVVPPLDMTGLTHDFRSGLHHEWPQAQVHTELYNSPQHLRASAVSGSQYYGGQQGHVEVIVSGAQPYLNKTTWSPQPLRSTPGNAKALGNSITKGNDPFDFPDKTQLTFLHQMLAWQLGQCDANLAYEIVNIADQQRLQRVRKWEYQPSASMLEAITIIAACRQKEPYTSVDAESIVRRRMGKSEEHPLHVYGFLLHLSLYSFTALAAIIAYVQMAIVAIGKASIESKSIIETVLLVFLAVLFGLPLAVGLVAIGAVPDILLLLVRPLLPSEIKAELTQWFFPSSLAFWSCSWFAPAAHLLLGACPLDDGFFNMSLGGERCNVQIESEPPSCAFQAAVACSPRFLAKHKHLRQLALRGVKELYASAGGTMAQMPLIVQWAYLLRDTDLYTAWEAETMGCLPSTSCHGFEIDGAC